jgi:hypothetical protein
MPVVRTKQYNARRENTKGEQHFNDAGPSHEIHPCFLHFIACVLQELSDAKQNSQTHERRVHADHAGTVALVVGRVRGAATAVTSGVTTGNGILKLTLAFLLALNNATSGIVKELAEILNVGGRGDGDRACDLLQGRQLNTKID